MRMESIKSNNEISVEQSACFECRALCCSRNLVNVCGYDVWTIARELYIEPTDFVAFAELGEDSPYNVKLDGSDRAFCLVLYMRELPSGDRCCVFAVNLPNNQVRCGIYPFRPIGCRAYPLALFDEEVAVKPWALCPEGVWNTKELDLAYWRGELERHDMEFSIYAFVVENWNRAVVKQQRLEKLDLRPFLEFLMEVYSRLEVGRKTVPAEAWAGIWRLWRKFTVKGLNPLSLKESATISVPYWDLWLGAIREVVTEANQRIQLHEQLLTNYLGRY